MKGLDRWIVLLWVATTVLMFRAIWMVFLFAPEEKVMGAVQKVFYFHVPAALVTYAVDSLLMKRPRSWDFFDLNLVGDAPNCMARVKPRPNCPLCGGQAPANAQ